MDHLATYIEHVVIRGVIYRSMRHVPLPVLLIIGAVACFLVVRRSMRGRKGASK